MGLLSQWVYVLGEKNDQACWEGAFFLNVWLFNGVWWWLVTDLIGKCDFGEASSLDSAKTQALNALANIKIDYMGAVGATQL